MNQNQTQIEISELLDVQLLEILKNGIEKFSGQTDAAGVPIMIRERPSPAMYAQIINRLKMLKLSSVPVANSPAGDLVAEAQRRGINGPGFRFNGQPIKSTLPPLSDGADAATG